MSESTIGHVVVGITEEMTCPDRDASPPTGVEETQEADDVCSCSAELAHMVRKIESVLAAQAALAMRMEAMLAALGAELVGSDAYSRALALVPLVLAGR